MDGTAERLLTKLKDIPWTWSKVGAEQVIASLGARRVQGVPGRSTYETVEGPRLSLYSEGDLAEFVEITLEAFQDPHLLSEVEYEQKANEFLQKFRAAVANACRPCSTWIHVPRAPVNPPGGGSSPRTASAPFARASSANWPPSTRDPANAKNTKPFPTRRES